MTDKLLHLSCQQGEHTSTAKVMDISQTHGDTFNHAVITHVIHSNSITEYNSNGIIIQGNGTENTS